MILDTNALSAWAQGEAALLAALPNDRPWTLPVIAVGEFRYGIRRSRERARLERWLSEVQQACRVITVDLETAEHYAVLRNELRSGGTPIPENDLWIAALCRQHDLPVVSQDRHFERVRGLKRVSW